MKNTGSKERVYNFIVDFILKNCYSPSVREISRGTGLSSTSSIYVQLKVLKEQGLIEYETASPRTIRLIGYKVVKE